jgi:hypothetical protein
MNTDALVARTQPPETRRFGRADGQRMPARINDWTNCRWNSRKPTSSGAEVMSVAAVMIDQSTPWSVD